MNLLCNAIYYLQDQHISAERWESIGYPNFQGIEDDD